jgi:hypothetical protein
MALTQMVEIKFSKNTIPGGLTDSGINLRLAQSLQMDRFINSS